MSNRFRKLKLTRTLRVGSSKLAPMESRSIPLDKTLILTDVGPGKKSLSDDGRLRRKSKDTKSVEFNLGNIASKSEYVGSFSSACITNHSNVHLFNTCWYYNCWLQNVYYQRKENISFFL